MVNSHWPTPFDRRQSSPYLNKPEYRRFTDSPQSTPTCWFSTLFMTIYAQTFSACFIQNLIPNCPLIAVCLSRLSPLCHLEINSLCIMLYIFILQYKCKIGNMHIYVQINYILLLFVLWFWFWNVKKKL